MSESQHFDLARDDADVALDAAAAAMAAGRLVVVPTETVYGLAAREDHPGAVARLSAFKAQRTAPFSLAVGDIDQLAARLDPATRPARRIAARWWPGPVTQVLPGPGGTLGVRVPGHPWTRALAERCGPLLLPSANRPGEPAPREVGELDPAVLAEAAVVVDGGRSALGEASTVVAPGVAALRVLREGVVSRADLAEHALGHVLVVCTGNTCRSPMARLLLERALARRAAARPGLLAPVVRSAGLFAGPGSPASVHAQTAMTRRGLDLGGHRSHPIDPLLLRDADLVLGMTEAHVEGVRSLLEDPAVPVALIDPAGGAIEDPFGGSLRTYESCAAVLERLAEAWAERLDPLARSDEPPHAHSSGMPQEQP